ncbi:MAG: hypothetical protein KA342_00635 [Aminivibrio sp.]|nr:hypothetical protein [Aminivibrio sp.]
MRQRRMPLLLSVMLLVLSPASGAWGLPDLVPWVARRGVPAERGGEIVIPLSVTVQNRGTSAAGLFKVSVEFEVVSGGRPGLLNSGGAAFRVPGQRSVSYPVTSAPLPPGAPPASTVTFTGEAVLPASYSGTTIRLRAVADSTAGEEFADPAGRVRESDETNNASPWADAVLSAGTPDLRVWNQTPPLSFSIEGEKIVEYRGGREKFIVTVINGGTAPSGPFSVHAAYEMAGGGTPGTGTILPDPPEAGRSAGLAPGQKAVFDRIVLKLPVSLAGARVRFRLVIDPDNRVRESDERNNAGPLMPVSVLPVRTMRLPGSLVLPVLGDRLRGRIRLNNFAGPTDDFQLDREPARRDDSFISIGEWRTVFTPPFFHYGSGATRSWYYLNDINADFGGPRSLRFVSGTGIAAGKIAGKVIFETGGDYEIRGWEYTRPNWYDSPPDVDIVHMEISLSLRPVIRNGRISYDQVTVSPDIRITLHGFWKFVDNAILSRGIVDYLRNMINTEVKRQLEAALLLREVREAAESSIEAAVRPTLDRLGVRRLLSVRVEGDSLVAAYE